MTTPSPPCQLILASSSKYRKLLLRRLHIEFATRAPCIDESPQAGELPGALVQRLALSKARSVAIANPDAIVIGSDQIAVFADEIIGKPGSRDASLQQLTRFNGRSVEFMTAVCVLRNNVGFCATHIDRTLVEFRDLRSDEIERYIDAEQPFDCAGAFKAEALGITLFRRVVSEDPTALVGLPLIRTSEMLRRAGLQLP